MVIAFVDQDQSVELLMTSIYWGKIQGKWEASVDPATAESLVELASETFDCRHGPVADHLVGCVDCLAGRESSDLRGRLVDCGGCCTR